MEYGRIERGTPNALSYRIFLKDKSGPISAYHDVPLYADADKKLYHMVVVAPRWTNAKMLMGMRDALNPIKQDARKGCLRYIANCFPHHGYIWNVGILPQTWKSPELKDDDIATKGDSLPLEVLEIGDHIPIIGEVVVIKVLGTIACVGEGGWRVIAINIKDPQAADLNDLADVANFFPGLIKATLEWLRIYQIPDGKSECRAGYFGEVKTNAHTHTLIHELNEFWKLLITNVIDPKSTNCLNTTIEDSPCKIAIEDATALVNGTSPLGLPMPLDKCIDKWHFIELE